MTAPTWHYGVTARWWAEFNTSGPEIDYFRRYVEDSLRSTSRAVPAGSCSRTCETASTSTAATSRRT